MSWPRLQSGFAALEKQYGSSLLNVNAFALMAYKFDNSVAADAAFKPLATSGTKKRGARKTGSRKTKAGPNDMPLWRFA
ncbi:MAG: hypothetical protein NVS1B11_28920 [Terriglobales bacterium]